MKKGFTLIELLAVIIILAILMIIAIPNILNTLRTARQKSFITQAQSIYKTAEQQFVISSMNNNTVACFDDSGSSNLDLSSKSENLKYYVKLTRSTGKVEEIEVQDTAQGFKIVLTPSTGNDYVLQNDISLTALTTGATGERSIGSCSGGGSSNNNNNNNTAFGGTCVDAPSGNEEHSGLPATYKGICYLDPKDLSATCDSNSTLTSGNTGCKKFYIYDDSGSTYKMIMDRNTTATVAWNSACTYEDLTTCETMGEVATALSTDTAGWSGSPRLITADEVAAIVGIEGWFVDTANFIGYYFGTKDTTSYSSQTNEQKAFQKSYYWLFDHTSGCTSYGCVTSDSSTSGYWTSDYVRTAPEYAWNVTNYGGVMIIDDYSNADYLFGVRPVITLSKSIAS